MGKINLFILSFLILISCSSSKQTTTLKEHYGSINLIINFDDASRISDVNKILISIISEEVESPKTISIKQIETSITKNISALPIDDQITIEVIALDLSDEEIGRGGATANLADKDPKTIEITVDLEEDDEDCDDVDEDGFLDSACGGDDCDDADASINPDASEHCYNLIDDDCDDFIDMDDVLQCDPNCVDNDNDGHQDMACGKTDCDDSNPSIYPGATETCDNGIDEDCDGEDEKCCGNDKTDSGEDCGEPDLSACGGGLKCEYCTCIPENCHDLDGDLSSDEACGGADCDDTDITINPNADEICDDLIDNDCDDEIDLVDEECSQFCDADDDGYLATAKDGCPAGDDCDDTDGTINPDAIEDCIDGIDNNCDEIIDMEEDVCISLCDSDDDGYFVVLKDGCPAGDDCDDENPLYNPSATDICFDEIDNDCDERDDPIGTSCIIENTFGGNGADIAHEIKQTQDSGFIVVGESNSTNIGTPVGNIDVYALKLNSSGAKTWEYLYGTANDDRAYSVAQKENQGFVIAGESYVNTYLKEQAYTLQIDSSGTEINGSEDFRGAGSSHTLKGSDRAYGIAETLDNKFWIAGMGYSGEISEYDFYIIKLKLRPILLDYYIFDGSSYYDYYDEHGVHKHLNDYAYSIARKHDKDDFIIVGSSFNYASILKINTGMFNDTWELYGTQDYNDSFNSIQNTSGGFIVGGVSNNQTYILKLDVDGVKQGEPKTLPGGGILSIIEAADGNYIAACDNKTIIKISSDLENILWTVNTNGFVNSIVPSTTAESYIAVGYKEKDPSSDPDLSDIYVIEVWPNGKAD